MATVHPLITKALAQVARAYRDGKADPKSGIATRLDAIELAWLGIEGELIDYGPNDCMDELEFAMYEVELERHFNWMAANGYAVQSEWRDWT